MSQDFDALAARFPRITVTPPEDETPPDPEDTVAAALATWASAAVVADVFIPWLNARIDVLDDEETVVAKDHAALLLAKGQKIEAKLLRDQFLMWRGTPRKERQ